MTWALAIVLALDAAFGEPRWLWSRVPHPVVLMGKLIGWADRTCNTGDRSRYGGAGVLALVLLVVGAISVIPRFLPMGWALEILFAAILIAHRALVQHVGDVVAALCEGLAPGRAAVSHLVGRDPATLDEAGVARAAIESAAENFADGVVAPAFWFAVAGLPGIAL